MALGLIPGMLKNKWGRLIVSSPVVSGPPADRALYTIGKSAQEALVLTLSDELKYTRVTANILRVKMIDEKHVLKKAPSSENVFWTTPEEIWAKIEYLCSEEPAAVNGARLLLYGSM